VYQAVSHTNIVPSTTDSLEPKKDTNDYTLYIRHIGEEEKANSDKFVVYPAP
jgi:hypothetical protein